MGQPAIVLMVTAATSGSIGLIIDSTRELVSYMTLFVVTIGRDDLLIFFVLAGTEVRRRGAKAGG